MNRSTSNVRIDAGLQELVDLLNSMGVKTKGCCNGHGKYPASVVIQVNESHVELFSGAVLPNRKRFYKTDADNQFFIPEQIKALKGKKAFFVRVIK